MLQTVVSASAGLMTTYHVERAGVISLGSLGRGLVVVSRNIFCRYLISPEGEMGFFDQQCLASSRMNNTLVGGKIDLAAYMAGAFKGLCTNCIEGTASVVSRDFLAQVLPTLDLSILKVERFSLVITTLQSADKACSFMMRRRIQGFPEYLTGAYTLPTDLLHEAGKLFRSSWLQGNLDSIDALVRSTGETPQLRGAGSAGILSSPLRANLMKWFKGITCHEAISLE